MHARTDGQTRDPLEPGRSLSLRTLGLALAALLAARGDLQSQQTFDSGSTGADGALNITGDPGTTVTFDPAAFTPPLDPDGDNVYHFTTITVAAGVTVKLSSRQLGTTPVYWLATGDVVIDGTLDLDGEQGHSGALGVPRVNAMGGAGGYPGGVGGDPASPTGQNGFGPGGGTVGSGANGRHATAYGSPFLIPLIGGSGGAGHSTGEGGGGGGGALLIATSGSITKITSITVNGAIQAAGGSRGGGGGSGSGSGGAVRLLAPRISGSGSISVAGGGPWQWSSDAGRVRLESFEYAYSGSIDVSPGGTLRVVTLTQSTRFLPDDTGIPAIRVTRVAGVDVPPRPTGSFFTPDVTINSPDPVQIDITARNVPLGTIVKLTLMNETNVVETIDSTPLAGTLESSTATAQVTFASGFTRVFTQATVTQN